VFGRLPKITPKFGETEIYRRGETSLTYNEVRTMSLITIELAESKDAERLADISKRAFDSDIEHGAPGPGGPLGYDSSEHQKRMIENTSGNYLKILYDGKIVGGTTAYKISDTHYEIFNVFVDPEYHRKGIGKESFKLIMEKYPEAKRWTLDTPDWNTRTKSYYERLGFKQYGIFRWVPTFDLRAYELLLDPEYKIETTRIVDVEDNDKKYIIEGTVDSISEGREVFSKKDNKHHQVAEAVVTDASGSMKLSLWNEMIPQIKEGEKIRIETASISKFKDEMQLNVSKGGRIAILHSS
jgi:RimJ/RimL family protein N-acetyltransferase